MLSRSLHVVEVTEANFQIEVVEYCNRTPVVVDLWADWCGPCKTLGPVLEELADEYDGLFRLAKVDVDKNPGIASAFQAQSIPLVVALFQGQLADQFVGAKSKQDVRAFVDGVLTRAGISPPQPRVEPPSDPVAAEAFWKARLDADAKDPKALLELGRVLFNQGLQEQAAEMLGRIEPGADEYSAARATLALGKLLVDVAEAGGQAAVRKRQAEDPDDPQGRYLGAILDGAAGRFAVALETLVDLVAVAPKDTRDQAKKAAAVVFDVAGRGEPEVEQLRKKLARLLF